MYDYVYVITHTDDSGECRASNTAYVDPAEALHICDELNDRNNCDSFIVHELKVKG